MNKHITQISAVNLKGQTFTHDLNKITIFVGPNEVGKTARFDAILLAQLGYKLKPGQKPMKTPAAIFRSCGQRGGGATNLMVANTMSDSQVIRRSWTMKREKISYAGPDDSYIPQMMLDPSGFFAISGPERRNLVLQQVDLEALGIGWAPLRSKLLEMDYEITKTEFAKTAFSEVCGKAQTLENERMAESLKGSAGPGDGNIYDWLTKVVDAITALRDKESSLADTHEQTLRGLTDNKATDNDMTALQSVQPEINAARERHTAAVATEATALAAFTAVQRKVEETKAVAAKMVDETATRAQIAAKQAEIEQHRLVKMPTGQFEAKVMESQRPTDTAERHARSVADAKAQEANRVAQEATAEMKRLECELDAAKAATMESAPVVELAKQVPHPGPRTVPNVMIMRPTENKARNDWQMKADEHFTIARRKTNVAEGIVQLKNEIKAASQKTTCPSCGHDIRDKQVEVIASLKRQLAAAIADEDQIAKDVEAAKNAERDTANHLAEVQKAIEKWDADKLAMDAENESIAKDWTARNDAYDAALRTIADAVDAVAKVKSLHELLKKASGRHVSTGSVAAIAVGNLSDAQAALEVAEKEIAAWDTAKAALDQANQTAVRAHNAKVTAYNTAQTAINAAQQAIQRLTISIEANQTARDAQALLADLQTAVNEASAAYVVARDAVPPIADQIRQLEAKQRQFIARTQNERLAGQSRTQLATATERLAVFKAALKVVSEEKLRAGEEAFNGLLKQARHFTDGILKAPLEFKDGELGFTHDGNFVEIGEFCGKESKFAMAGLGLALTQSNQGLKIVLIDELGTLDAKSKMLLLTRASELIAAGVINQFVGCDVSAEGYPPEADDFSIIRLTDASEQF